MARTVVLDSDGEDDEGEDELSTNLYKIQSANYAESSDARILRRSGESTDPAQFQALYDISMAAINAAPSDPPSSIPLPTFEELVRGPSCPAPAASSKTTKLQRSKTINDSSLSSIGEPTASNKKVKRTKSAFDARDLTQITTPSGKENAPHDTWDPSLDNGLDMYSAVKNRRAALEKKTYGKQKAGKSRTINTPELEIAQQPDSSIEIFENDPSSCAKAATSTDHLLISPDLPRPARGTSNTFIHADRAGHLDRSNSQVLDPTSTSSKSTSIQVPRSTSEEAVVKASEVPASTAISLPPATREAVTSSESVDHGPRTFQAVTVVETLTPSQKRQYKHADVVPIDDTPMPTVDTAPFSDLTSSRFEELIGHDSPSNKASIVMQYGLNGTTNQMKVPTATSSSGVKRGRSASVSHEVSQKSNKLRRVKTTEHQTTPVNPPVENDAFTSENIDLTSLPRASVKNKRRMQTETNTDSAQTDAEDLFSFDEIGLPAERYVPRPSRRRQLDVVIDQAADDVPRSLRLARPPTNPSNDSGRLRATGTAPMDNTADSNKLRKVATHDDIAPTDESIDVVHLSTSVEGHDESPEAQHQIDSSETTTRNAIITPLSVKDVDQQLHGQSLESDRDREYHTSSTATTDLVNSIIRNASKRAKAGNFNQSPSSVEKTHTIVDIPSPVTERLSPAPEAVLPTPSAPKLVRKRKGRARTKTMPVFHSESVAGDSDEDPIVAKRKPVRAKKSGMVSAELSRPAASHEVLEVVDEGVEEETAVSAPAPATKKKLGRGKKSVVADQTNGPATTVEEVDASNEPQASVSEEATNAPLAGRGDNETRQTSIESSEAPIQTPIRNDVIVRDNTTGETEKTTKKDKGPDKHSPLPSSVVRYRIGLSKKSKIAPLLKIRPTAKKT